MASITTRLEKLEKQNGPTEYIEPISQADAIGIYCALRQCDFENKALLPHVEDGHTHRPELMTTTSVLQHLRAYLLESGIDPEVEYQARRAA